MRKSKLLNTITDISILTKRLSLKYVVDRIDATCSSCIDKPPKYAPYVNLLNGINTRSHKPFNSK